MNNIKIKIPLKTSKAEVELENEDDLLDSGEVDNGDDLPRKDKGRRIVKTG